MDFKDLAVLIIALMLGVLLFFDKIDQNTFLYLLIAILIYFGVPIVYKMGVEAGKLSKGG